MLTVIGIGFLFDTNNDMVRQEKKIARRKQYQVVFVENDCMKFVHVEPTNWHFYIVLLFLKSSFFVYSFVRSFVIRLSS